MPTYISAELRSDLSPTLRHLCPEEHGEIGLIPLMSCKSNCWDSACVESFLGTHKCELVYHRYYATGEEAQQDLFEYIEISYQSAPLALNLGYHSPDEYEARATVA